MNKKKTISIKKNIIINTIRLCLNALFPLITLPYVSRVLHPVGVGQVNLALSVVVYFTMFASLGIPLYGLREAARIRDDKPALSQFVREILVFNGISTILVLVCYCLFFFVLPDVSFGPYIFFIVGLSIPFSFIGLEWLYQALEQYTYITIRSFIFQAISFVLLFVLVKTESDVAHYAALIVFASIGPNIVNFLFAKKHIRFIFKGKINLKKHIKPIFSLFLLTAAGSFYLYLTTIILGFISGVTAVGNYTTALKIVAIAQGVIGVSAVVSPRSSYLLEKNDFHTFQKLVSNTTRLTLLLLLPLVTGVLILAPDLIELFAGPLFLDAVPVLQIAIIKVLFIGISYITVVQVLIPQRKEYIGIISYIIAAIVSIVLNFMLIPVFSSIGAAISTTIVEAVVTFIQLYFCRDTVGKAILDKRNITYLIGTCFVLITTIFLRTIIDIVVLRILVSGIIGVLIYAFVLLLAKDEFLLLIFSSLRKRKI